MSAQAVEVPEVAKAWTMREVAHFNGGKVWFGYLFQCVEHPRLERFDRYDRKTRSVNSTWRVGGVDQENLAAAVACIVGAG